MFIRDIQEDQQPDIVFKWEVEVLAEFWEEEEKSSEDVGGSNLRQIPQKILLWKV